MVFGGFFWGAFESGGVGVNSRVYTQQELDIELLKQKTSGFEVTMRESIVAFEAKSEARLSALETRFDAELLVQKSINERLEKIFYSVNTKLNAFIGITITAILIPTVLRILGL